MGDIRFMKDVFGKDIEVGDYVSYMVSASNRHFEKAIVVESEEGFVKIEYVGEGSNKFANKYGHRKKGKTGRLTATDKKIIILSSSSEEGRDVYREERKRFKEEIEKIRHKLVKALEREKYLISKNTLLQEEAEKINNPWDILDFGEEQNEIS